MTGLMNAPVPLSFGPRPKCSHNDPPFNHNLCSFLFFFVLSYTFFSYTYNTYTYMRAQWNRFPFHPSSIIFNFRHYAVHHQRGILMRSARVRYTCRFMTCTKKGIADIVKVAVCLLRPGQHPVRSKNRKTLVGRNITRTR